MIKKVLAMVAIALTAMLLLPPEPADARRGGGGGGGFRSGGGGGGAFRGGGGRGFRAVSSFRGGGGSFRAGPVYRARPVYFAPRRVVRRVYVAPVIYRGGGCGWLRQRAIVTGSPYWWRRYHLCIGY